MIQGTPLPSTDDPSDAAFWQGTLIGELRVQRCGACQRLRFPPRPMCPHCHSLQCEWIATSGRGHVWSFVVPHPPLLPAFAEKAPYNVVLVQLDEAPDLRMVGNLLVREGGAIDGVDPRSIEIGTRVKVVFDRVAEDVALPRWIRDEG